MDNPSIPRNPYIAGKPLTSDDGFFGREKIIKEVRKVLESGQNNVVVLYGQRRIGKTSILHKLERLLPTQSFFPVYIDLMDKAGKPITEVLYEIAFTCAVKASIEFDDKDAFRSYEAFQKNFLPLLYKKLIPGTRLVFLFDEFDVLDLSQEKSPETAGYAFPSIVRNLIATLPDVCFVFVVGRHWGELTEGFLATFKSARNIPVFILDKDDAVALIKRGESEGAIFGQDAIDEIMFFTHGHPYFTQLLCQEIFNTPVFDITSGKKIVTPQIVRDSIPAALESGAATFQWIWKWIPAKEQFVFSAIAESAEPGVVLTKEQIANVLQGAGVQVFDKEFANAPDRLVESQLLERTTSGGYCFVIEIIRRWVVSNHPLWQMKEELYSLSPLADNLYLAALAYCRVENYTEAARLLLQALQDNPNHVRARCLRATIHHKMGEFEDAIRELKESYLLDENEVRFTLRNTMLDYINQLENREDLVRAEQICIELLEIQEDETTRERKKQITEKLGDSYRSNGNFASAYSAYLSVGAVQKTAELIRTLSQNALLFERQRKWKDANEIYTLLARLQPDQSNWHIKQEEVVVKEREQRSAERILFIEFFRTLAGKLTAIMAFAILIIIVLAILGNRIPAEFRGLIYIISIGAFLVFSLQVFIRSKPYRKESKESSVTVASGQSVAITDARYEYLRSVVDDSRPVRLVGLDTQFSDPARVSFNLASVFVSLDTTTMGETENEPELEREKSSPISATQALGGSKAHRMVLLGLPGSGKSTFVRYLALQMAQAGLDQSWNIQDVVSGWQGKAVLPIVVSLRRLAETVSPNNKHGSAALVEDFIVESLKSDARIHRYNDQILSDIEKIGGLVMFDGLDEVANLALRPVIVEAVEDFSNKYSKHPSSRFLVTCRTYSYFHDREWQFANWATYELALLDNAKIQAFVNAFYDEEIRIDPARRVQIARQRETLLYALLGDDQGLYELARNPLLLTVLVVAHNHYGELPDTRAQLYQNCVDLLLVRWERVRSISDSFHRSTILDELEIPNVVLNAILSEVAFKSLGDSEDSRLGLITEDLIIGVSQVYFRDLQKAQLFLDYCQSSNGLLMPQGVTKSPDLAPDAPTRRLYSFPHLVFVEYLAARYLISMSNMGQKVRELVQKSDRWREVINLMGEYLCFSVGDKERMEALFNALLPEEYPPQPDHLDWRGILYAGNLLTLYRRAFPSKETPIYSRISLGMKNIVEIGALSPRERAMAADILDELGYLPEDISSFNTISDFVISTYPVTNGQYARFLNSEDFQDKELWCNLPKFDENAREMKSNWGEYGWNWLQEVFKNQDYYVQGGVVLPRYWRDPNFGIKRHNAPVVGLTWYEASAYCNWLLKNWDELDEGKQGWQKPKQIRLPNEREWIMAAGGEENNRLAYGVLKDMETITRYANTLESNINHTTPVWMYPLGKSPNAIMDMSGNIWEWQINFGDKQNILLALRGGSWLGGAEYSRIEVRSQNLPSNYARDIGFRVIMLFE